MRRDDDVFPFHPGLKFVPILYRHDPGHDRNGDSRGPNSTDPVEEDVGIIEHLGEDKVCTCIDLLFEPRNLLISSLVSVGRFRMTLWKASYCNAEVAGVMLVDKVNEIGCAVESAGGWFPCRGTFWWIAAESENIFAAMGFCLLRDDSISRHWAQ